MQPSQLMRSFSKPVVLGLVILVGLASTVRADQIDPDQIKAILRTTTDGENAFVDQVVKMVNAGTLPREIFASTFIWARKKPKHRFQYFKSALIARAAEAGITL